MKRTGIIVLLVLLNLIGIPLILLNTSYFQQKLVNVVTTELAQKTGAKIYIEDSDIDLFRGIVFHHVQINDRLNHRILKTERLDVGVRIIPLLSRRIELDAFRLIGADIRLSRKTPESELNIQPIINAFAKKKKKESALPWRIDASTVLLRHCRIRYDVLSEPLKSFGIDKNHLDFSQTSTRLGFKMAPHKHYQLWIDKFQAVEKCGLKIDQLRFQAKLSNKGFNLKNFELKSAHSGVEVSALDAKYNDLSAFSNFADSVRFNSTNIKLVFVPSDFVCIKPSYANITKPINVDISVQGKLSDFTCNNLRINMQELILLDARITLKGLPDIQDLYMNGQIKMLQILPEGLEYLSGVMTHRFSQIPALRNLGKINYMGHINTVDHRWVLTGDFSTAAGNVGTNIQLSQKGNTFNYEGKVTTDAFQLNILFPEEKSIGEVAFDVSVKGLQNPKNGFSGSVDGIVPHFFYKGYVYQKLTLKGDFNNHGFKGDAILDDDNARLIFSGLVNLSSKSPKFKFDLYANEINLRPLNLTNNTGKSSLAFNLHSDFEGGTIDELLGKVTIDSLTVYNNQKSLFLEHFNLVSGRDPGYGKHIMISSSLLNGEIWGNYQFSTLIKSVKCLFRSYFPSLILKPEIPDFKNHNDFNFQCSISPSKELSNVLNIPLVLNKNIDIRGYYNDLTGKFRLKADVPELTYGKTLFKSAGLLFENPQKEAKLIVFAQIGSDEKPMKLNIDARSFSDNTFLKLNISNSAVKTYSGNIQSDLHFSMRSDGKLTVAAKLKQSDIIVGDSLWRIHPTNFLWDSDRLFVEDFQLTHSGQFIKIQGFASGNSSDTLSISMNSFSLDDMFMLLPQKKSNLHFGGLVSGNAQCVRILKDPAMDADLFVDRFSFNHVVLGSLTAKSKWNSSLKALALDAVIRSNEKIGGVNKKIATATGSFYPTTDSLYLSIIGNRLPLGFLEPYLGKILYKMEGFASGNIHLIGPVKHLGIYAQAYVADASFGVEMLHTRYYFSDSVLLSPRMIAFRNVEVKDREGNKANATGIIRHNHFKNMQTSIDIKGKNILAMDIPASSDAYFYGTAYCTGSVSINGLENNTTIDVDMRTENKTNATISFLDNKEEAEYSFINFIQKKKVNEDYNLENKKKRQVLPTAIATSSSNLTVNLQIEATPSAELTLITDPSSGDEIKARGSGAIRAVFRNSDDIQLFGRYTIENGSYKFIYENLLRRDFNIQDGGSINFSGDPFAAELNIKANYTVNAKLSDLLSTEDINSLNLNRSSIPVNCVLKLDGELQKPSIQLDLAYPSADDDLKRRITNVINTDEMMNQQIVFLMLFGRFSTPTYSNLNATSNMSTVLNTTISTVSSQLNNMINDVFGQSKVSFDFDYTNQAYELGAPGEWKVGMSGKWLDNRLTFNGNLGSREDLSQTGRSQFIGEFDINIKFKNSKKWSAKFFNKANDNRYFKSALNTQGAGLVYKEDFNTLTDLFKQMVESIVRPFKKKTK
ncbi:MAG: translocation/assembly module TamB domain-containing protein [Bacteroidales bacterium]|nr:translocation/assembly module TamB domain-containing protein [Bacteroidales bacterium]